jgi:hypothetical protein
MAALPAGPERDRLLEISLRDGLEYGESLLAKEDGAFIARLLQELPPDAQERSAWNIGKAMAARGQIPDVAAITEDVSIGSRCNWPPFQVHSQISLSLDRPKAESLLETLDPGISQDAALDGMVSGTHGAIPRRRSREGHDDS